jgi:hypothetical protein
VPGRLEEDVVSYEERTKAELQDELRDRDLPVSGAKADLVARLEDADRDDAGDLTKAELQDRLRDLDLPVSGSKAELQDRLDEARSTQETDDEVPDDEGAPDDGGAPDDEDDRGDDDRTTDDQTGEDAISSDTSDQTPNRASATGGRRPPKPLQLARLAARQIEQLSGRRVDGTSGLERTEEGWRIVLELVEAARIPPATDVLGSYEVIVDDEGDLLRYERIRRYIRGQAGDDQL